MIVDGVYLAFAALGLALFRVVRPVLAVTIVLLGGWVLLPVGHYPPGAAQGAFPYWLTGNAVPSEMLLTKAWLAPAVATLGLLAVDRASLLALRPRWLDLPVLVWCLWPWVQAVAGADASPDAGRASLYLAGTWGLPWLLGRACFGTRAAQQLLVRGLVASALVCLPFALIEGVVGPVTYGWLYELHPFRFDGSERYLGHRPIGFFEHGNQYGLWMSLCALGALWLARATAAGPGARPSAVPSPSAARMPSTAIVASLAFVVGAMAVAAQSVGAIALWLLGAAFLTCAGRVRPRHMAAGLLAFLVLGGAVYLSGALPIMRIGRETALGQHVVEGLRAIGRGSFAWRVSQDQRLMAEATLHPLIGHARWDWWRGHGTRPWGLAVLVLGQFGALGLCAAFATLLGPALRTAWHAPRASGWRPDALPLMLSCLVVLAALDALMNSFVFFPAILIAGALASR